MLSWFRVKGSVWQGDCFNGEIRCYETLLTFLETMEKLVVVDDSLAARARLVLKWLRNLGCSSDHVVQMKLPPRTPIID